MSLIEDYLNSELFVRNVASACGNRHNTLTVRTRAGSLIASALRWHQLFDNPNVNQHQLGMQQLNIADLRTFMQKMTRIIGRSGVLFASNFECNLDLMNLLKIEALKAFSIKFNDLSQPKTNKLFYAKLAQLQMQGATKFHGFNGVFAESIRDHGVNPNAKIYQQEELDYIDNILRRAGYSLGYSAKDRDSVSYATSPKVTYNYAAASPEWFKLFCGGDTFVDLDYIKAEKNIMSRLKNKNVSAQEYEDVFLFFDKYWDIFTAYEAANPKVVMTPYYRNETERDAEFKRLSQNYRKLGSSDLVNQIFQSESYAATDLQSKEALDAKHAQIISLPNFSVLYEKVNNIFQKQNEQNQGLNR